MKNVDGRAIRLVHWAIPLLTIGIFIFDLLTPVGLGLSIFYVLPLLLTIFTSRMRDPMYYCGLATGLVWVGLSLKPPGNLLVYGVLNRTFGTFVLWIVALGLVRFRRMQQEAVEGGQELMAERLERARTETVMRDAQEARYHADREAVLATVGREAAEAQLLISRLRLEGIIESAMDAIITVDEDQKVIMFNRAAEQMFGCSTREAIGHPIDRFVPSRFREAHRHHVQTFGQSGVSSRKMGKLGTVMGLRSNGEEFPIEAAISHLEVERKRYYTVILRDITERKQAEEALHESQRQLTTLIGNLPGYVYRCRKHRDGTLQYISEGVFDLTGYTVDEYLTRGLLTFGEQTHPGDPEPVPHEVQAALAQHRPFETTYRILTKSGEVKWVWERGEGVYASDGTLNYVEGFVTDITERKRAEHLLRQSEERYRRLIDVSPYAVLVNRGGRILFANDQGIKLFGAIKADEILGKSMMDLFHPDDHTAVRRTLHQVLEGSAQVPMLEDKIVTMSGTSVDVEVSTARFVDEEGPAVLIMLRDISERKRLQEQLRKTERIAELGTLASGMAHEIGTPMNVILGRAEYLMDRVREEPARKGLQTIITQVERITKVMNQLLAFARRKSPERTAVSLKDIVEDGLELFRERLAKSRIAVELMFDENCPLAQADPDQMSQVFINLVMNAVHAMPDGGTLRIGLTPEKGMVKFTVADTGHGIPRDVIKKVFEPFFTTKEFGQGTGLGLTVVKGIIEEHQGSIAADSEEGKSTVITILLPACSSS